MFTFWQNAWMSHGGCLRFWSVKKIWTVRMFGLTDWWKLFSWALSQQSDGWRRCAVFFVGFFCKLCLIFELLLSLYLFSSYKPNIVSWIKYISLIFSVKLLLHELLVWGQNVCKMNPNTILRKGLMLIVLACLLIKLDHTSTMPVSFRSILAWI